MALDTQEKRMAAVGVGRPWMRTKLPGANDQEWRIASGNAYGGNVIAGADPGQDAALVIGSGALSRRPAPHYARTLARRGTQHFASGLNQLIHDGIDDLLTGVDLLLFSDFDGAAGDATWSTTCWATSLDLTGVSFWNTTPNHRAATLISPRHVLMATHHPIAAGKTLSFWSRDGTLVTRELSAVEFMWWGDEPRPPGSLDPDIAIGYLDSDMPDGWTFYKVLPTNYDEYFFSDNPYGYYPLRDKPVISLDQQRKALVYEIFEAHDQIYVTLQVPSGDRNDYYEAFVSGDSSYPTFLVIDKEPVLLGAHYTVDPYIWDSNCATRGGMINAMMEELDTGNTGYEVTRYDLNVAGMVRDTSLPRRPAPHYAGSFTRRR